MAHNAQRADVARESVRPANRVSLEEGRKLVMANARESSVLAAICGYLDAQRIPYARTDATEAFNRKGQRVRRTGTGWPDLTICFPGSGKLLACECKKGVGGRLSYVQAVCLEKLWQCGAIVVIARSVDDVIEVLKTGKTSAQSQKEIVDALQRGPKIKRKEAAR